MSAGPDPRRGPGPVFFECRWELSLSFPAGNGVFSKPGSGEAP